MNIRIKYDEIGTGYNITRKADPYLTGKLIEHLQPEEDGIYLDIGCGTGNYTSELQERGFRLTGMDPSEKMLAVAKRRNRYIDWKTGTAGNTGLPDYSVDGIIGSLTIHHWPDLEKGFSELSRVLKPDGRIVIFTSSPEQMKGYWLNHYFPKMLADSIAQMPDPESVQRAMIKSGMDIIGTEKYFIRPDLQDKFLYSGKHNPELYLDEQVRKGISSFSSLSDQSEVEQGLLRLQNDIASGKIREIIKLHENETGDYLYIIAKKISR